MTARSGKMFLKGQRSYGLPAARTLTECDVNSDAPVVRASSTAGAGNLGTTVTQSGGPTTSQEDRTGNGGLSPSQISASVQGILATFEYRPLTSNILGRVTGGSVNIFGTIQTTNFCSTNLYLMNQWALPWSQCLVERWWIGQLHDSSTYACSMG
jgi:hypothetical protein